MNGCTFFFGDILLISQIMMCRFVYTDGLNRRLERTAENNNARKREMGMKDGKNTTRGDVGEGSYM